MSKVVYESADGITLTRYVGPESLGADRLCYQITTADNRYVQLTAAQFDALRAAISGNK